MHPLLDSKMAPYHNLIEVFKKQKTQESAADFEESRRDSNFMRQNRVTVTPTLIKFSTGEEEESNRVIRNFKSKLPNFIQLSILTDQNRRCSYSNRMSNNLLGYVHSILSSGFKIGSLKFEFLGYSNSQLKNHSFWFLCQNNADLPITEEQVISYMGNFDNETKVLKKYARKG